ncbi:hypothetical protein JK386_07410 [Nocardioides sp. zg-536]|uniref:Uncharacterized protein n=1 Tax=Nocardioides faecalis TaxID=2803858 RepID=A0A938Y5R1_9ACTN|nr:hypothetical protein [Nocardioides faecalis]MBM9459727.1 hypothetical protein [Nocardioides faecalis]MBS4753496.1 hypothetical protein [Nocardioides faecalis]QVI58246.1 hypothetical protein KG111_14705 [Nocardioides faecalis]
MSARALRVVAVAACIAALAYAGIWFAGHRGPVDPDARAWSDRTATLLADALVAADPPHLIVPPAHADSYQAAQAVIALAGFGELTDADWSAFETKLASNLPREFQEGYTGPLALSAQVVTAAEAAGRNLDPEVTDLILGVADTDPQGDPYDAAAATTVRRWAAARDGAAVEDALSRDVRKSVSSIGCRGVEALFLQAALARAGVDSTGCTAPQREDLVAKELRLQAKTLATAAVLDSDTALRLRAASTLTATASQRAEVERLKALQTALVNDRRTTDGLIAAFALSQVTGTSTIAPSLVAFLHTVLEWGGAPEQLRLTPNTAAALARTFALSGHRSPPHLVEEAGGEPLETRARILLSRGASAAAARSLLSGATPNLDERVRFTAVFQLLLRHRAPLCSTWAETAQRQLDDEQSTLIERALAYRYLVECGHEDTALGGKLRAMERDTEEVDVRSIFRKRSVACALGDGGLPSSRDNWKLLRSLVDPRGGVIDDAGQLEVAETHMATAMLADQSKVCQRGAYW